MTRSRAPAAVGQLRTRGRWNITLGNWLRLPALCSMGQQQVHPIWIYDFKKRSMPEAIAMVGICTSGQQAPSGGDPICRLRMFPASGRCDVRQRGLTLRFVGSGIRMGDSGSSMSIPASAAASTNAGEHPAADCANSWAAFSLPRRLSQPDATSSLNSFTSPRRIAPHQTQTSNNGRRLVCWEYTDLAVQRGSMVDQGQNHDLVGPSIRSRDHKLRRFPRLECEMLPFKPRWRPAVPLSQRSVAATLSTASSSSVTICGMPTIRPIESSTDLCRCPASAVSTYAGLSVIPA
jgi:hypothetical protein